MIAFACQYKSKVDMVYTEDTGNDDLDLEVSFFYPFDRLLELREAALVGHCD